MSNLSAAALVVLASALVTGCAATAATSWPVATEPTGSHAHLALDTRAAAIDSDNAKLVQRAARAPELPSVDRLAPQLRVAAADVRLCIAPAGDVTTATLEQPSRSPAFDAAVLADVRQWKFAPLPGPTTVRSCQRATVVYQPQPRT